MSETRLWPFDRTGCIPTLLCSFDEAREAASTPTSMFWSDVLGFGVG